jgi:hypothetical protein
VNEDLVSVFWTQSWVEGEIVKGRLEAEGIPVDLKGPAEGPFPTGGAEVLVPASFEARARHILQQVESGSQGGFDRPDDGAGGAH